MTDISAQGTSFLPQTAFDVSFISLVCFTGILHKGDGTNIYLKEKPRKLLTVLGNGERREGNTVSVLL